MTSATRPASSAALEGVDAAYYLVHSLDSSDFEDKDADAARAFGPRRRRAGVERIIYLGGLGEDDSDLSAAPALAPRGRDPARDGGRAR